MTEDMPEDVKAAALKLVTDLEAMPSDGNVRLTAEAILAERERWQDKIEGLEADLDSAVEVAWNRGATEWVRMNYPMHFERLSGAAAIRGDGHGE